ncbi:uncharacterized protein BDZ99DRAFT_396562 [Mytilinidion resinicola]|uniref:Piwi domain-containing protein n=1 Tax=Mytilinidion resinicola TaxID=574789 RepID=A0A6A6Y8C1_9PEZI|nr:uncharacterized protein BDZ99DRAFT_396562 [Mytilinidion resinicola]KAF2805081.1 hypothetical protein BDZ99DRAFT_396562 [Mytilinidion resinicola]
MESEWSVASGASSRSLETSNEFSLLKGGAKGALDTIVLGADVSHPPGNGPDGSPSIAALVGSIDEHFITYLSSIRLQAGRTEITGDMEDMVKERLLAWKAKNKILPGRILFYRDGVSEGQYLEVISKEINAVTEAYQAVAGTDAKKPIITFLIVGKRHHTQFYPNQLSGTVDSTFRGAKEPTVTQGPALSLIRLPHSLASTISSKQRH